MTTATPQVHSDVVVITLPRRFTNRLRRIAIQREMTLEEFMLVCVAEYEKAKKEE